MLFLSCCVFNEWIALKLLFCFVYLSYDSNSTITYSFFEKSVFVKNKIINKKINDIVVVVAVDVVVELSKKRLDWEKNSSRATTTCTITTIIFHFGLFKRKKLLLSQFSIRCSRILFLVIYHRRVSHFNAELKKVHLNSIDCVICKYIAICLRLFEIGDVLLALRCLKWWCLP